MYTLLVIDPNEVCLPSKEDLPGYAPLVALEQEIHTAKALGCKIVVVNYPEMGPIHPCIRKLLAGYSHVLMVEKTEWIGARQIVSECRAFDYDTCHFRVCGFYTHKCLQSTVRGLKVIVPQCRIEVVKAACDDYEGNRWSTFPKLPGVQLV